MHVLKKYLTPAEEKKFFDAIKRTATPTAERDYNLLKLMRVTGGRVGSICGLTVGDASQALASGELAFRSEVAKGGRGYEVPVTKDVERHLRALLTIRRQLGIGLDPDAPLAVSRKGGGTMPLTTRSIQLRVAYWAQQAGLGLQVSPHWLRHTLGQRIVKNSTSQNPLGHAAGILGHRSLDSTRIYTRPTREDLVRTMQEAA